MNAKGILIHRQTVFAILREKIHALLPTVQPRKWWLDVLWIINFIFIQEIALPSVLPSWFYVDIITPWLVILFIVRHPRSSLLPMVAAALLLEGMSSVPAGFYFTAYALPWTILPAIRDKITWSFTAPWILSLGLTSILVHLSQPMILYALTHNVGLDPLYFASMFITICMVCSLGLFISRPYQSTEFFARGDYA